VYKKIAIAFIALFLTLLVFLSGYYVGNNTGESNDRAFMERISELENIILETKSRIQQSESLIIDLQRDNKELERIAGELRSENNKTRKYLAELGNNHTGFTESTERIDGILDDMGRNLAEIENRNTKRNNPP
jgi:peptidoglycan hydrolase CwlO-like protein